MSLYQTYEFAEQMKAGTYDKAQAADNVWSMTTSLLDAVEEFQCAEDTACAELNIQTACKRFYCHEIARCQNGELRGSQQANLEWSLCEIVKSQYGGLGHEAPNTIVRESLHDLFNGFGSRV